MIKDENQIREMLTKRLEEYSNFESEPEDDDNQYIYQGWVEALEWVLGETTES